MFAYYVKKCKEQSFIKQNLSVFWLNLGIVKLKYAKQC